MKRERADVLLVDRGLVETRDLAQRLIMAGQVRSGTETLVKSATMLSADAPLEVLQPERYVSRGGYKLEAALDHFGVDIEGKRCLDLGASTGGFSDCLLQRGAAHVIAVDVGKGLLHPRVAGDARVEIRDETNARAIDGIEDVQLVVADLSFISLRKVLPAVRAQLGQGGEVVVLFKPQFEAPRGEVPRDGVIRDAAVRARALAGFTGWAEVNGWRVTGTMESPLTGAKGNVEFLVRLLPAE